MSRRDRGESAPEAHGLQRRDVLRLFGAVVPAVTVLGAYSDDVVVGVDTGSR